MKWSSFSFEEILTYVECKGVFYMKKLSMLLLLLLMSIVIVACGTNDVEQANDDQTEENNDLEDVEESEEDVVEDEEESEPELKTDTGIYNGQADPHTIEIETSEGPKAFQLSDEARKQVEQLTEGAEVTYTYYQEGEQLIIQSIEASTTSGDVNTDEKITATGIYNGQADPHTIEIETDEGPVAFQLTLNAREDVTHLTEGEQVTFTYYQEGEQRVIETIQPSERVKMTETGIYVGQADPHTIEIETANGPQAFQLTMEARKDVEKLRDGREVTYTYYQDGVQLVIESIKEK